LIGLTKFVIARKWQVALVNLISAFTHY